MTHLNVVLLGASIFSFKDDKKLDPTGTDATACNIRHTAFSGRCRLENGYA